MDEKEIQSKKNLFDTFKTLARYNRQFGKSDLLDYWLFEKHRTFDKWCHYFPIYEKWFAPFRNTDLVFVEVGVQNGGSAQMWKKYFGKNAKIVGVDIDEKCKQFEEEQISIEIGLQEDREFWKKFREKYPRVDILLDDGGHTMKQQITTFQEMFPHVKDGGIYMCEDCHTSYMPTHGGGLKKSDTYIEFTKNLIDMLHSFYMPQVLPPNYFSVNMGGIHFYDSVVVVEKSALPFPPTSFRVGTHGAVEDFEDTFEPG